MSTEIIPRKKVCPKCGRNLWIKRDFYSYRGVCKDCNKAYKKAQYDRLYKVEEGVTYRNGRLMEHKGMRVAIYWSPSMIEKLKKHFATTKNEELAEFFGVSMRTVNRKASELGLSKDEEWMQEQRLEHQKLAWFTNKIRRNDGMIKKGERRSIATEFKKKIS